MNALRCASLSMLMLAGCASSPPLPSAPCDPVQVFVTVPVPCVTELPKAPEKCIVAADTHPEKLRCILVDKTRQDAYMQELEAVLLSCKGNPK
jgi:uncharacterized protein YcfL